MSYKKIYKDFIIENNDYPHSTLKFVYYHKYDTDGECHLCKTIAECMDEIDDWNDEFNPQNEND